LKGMLPKLKSGTYILVYRSSLGTFWSPLVHEQECEDPCSFVEARRGLWANKSGKCCTNV